ncbi:hypothetical protein GCM10023144_05020 [Pigmentiphaga soli]|uniref:VanZ family protein n=1 Tax=Pigmentiphaga soli TaxID=1007095 RepID=A0ABP8GGL6_9BURK
MAARLGRPTGTAGTAGARLPQVLRHGSVALVALTVAVAIVTGLLIPDVVPYGFFQEGGPVETLTVAFYVVAGIGMLVLPRQATHWPERIAVCIVLCAFAARELDLHKAMFGISILKSRFYNRDGTPTQIEEALAVLAPIAASLLWLALRRGRIWWRDLRAGRTWAVTVLLAMGAVVVAQCFDRAPDVLDDWFRIAVPEALRYVLQGMEESLEMLIPVLVGWAAWQAVPRGTDACAR